MKFDVIVGNPPFQAQAGKSKISIGTTLIKSFYNNLVKDGGTLAMISSSTFLGAGQKGLGYLFSENQVIDVQLSHKNYFPKIGIDIGSFVIKKSPSISTVINVENQNSKMKVDTALFKYEKTKPYIPRNINSTTLPILVKILNYNQDIFDFRASASKGAVYKVGFWAGANTGIHARYVKITNTGQFDSKWIDHPCKLDQYYPEENIKSVFAGRWFHFVITMISGNQSAGRPANLSFFPKVDLNTKWTFETLGDLFGMTLEEKQIVNDWAQTRSNAQWCD